MIGVFCCLLVIVQNLVCCQVQEADRSPDPLPTSTHDPYANVLSQLSDVMFEVEERLYRLTAPKYESENFKSHSDEGKESRRKTYFDRIRENYKALQDQLGQSGSSGGTIKLSDILNLNFQNKGPRSSLDLSLPFLPLSIQVDSKKQPTDGISGKNDKGPISDVNANVNLGMKSTIDSETPEQSVVVDKQTKIKPELQKRSGRPTRTASNRKIGNKGKSATDFHKDSIKTSFEEPLDWEDETGVQGRMLGDLLFSESTFDKYFRRVLKDHGKWMLDSTILPPKHLIEGIRGVTRDQFPSSKSSKSPHRDVMPFDSKKEPVSHVHQQAGSWKQDTGSKIVLAFTPDGLPLKLKIDHSIHKPIKYLHNILSEARVSLNIPVSTAAGIRPVGNGVLLLGFDDSGMASRTPLLDLSDRHQLNYLLNTLKKLKYDQH